MYLTRYQLKAAPFSAAPDPDFFFLCDRHAQARQYLDQVLWYDETFAAVLGRAGLGKTMLLRFLLDDLQNEIPLVALTEPPADKLAFLRALLGVLGFDDIEAGQNEYRSILSAYLVHQQARGSRPVLILDQLEAYPDGVLEELAWLASIGDGERPALHFILFGRDEFEAALDRPNLRDLGDQVRIRYRMRELSEGETLAYINHRLGLVGGRARKLLPEALVPRIFSVSRGVPARINALCDLALERAAFGSQEAVDSTSLEAAIAELGWAPAPRQLSEGEQGSLEAFRREPVGKLVITHNGKLCGTAKLSDTRTIIGRHKLNNIAINSHAVSRCHAMLVKVEQHYVLLDLNSTNGTFVNFKSVQQQVLKDNDIVGIGNYRFKFMAGEAASRQPAPASDLHLPTATMVLDGSKLAESVPAIKRVK